MMWKVFGIFLNIIHSLLYTGFLTLMLTPPGSLTKKEVRKKLPAFLLCSLLTAAALSSYLFFPMPKWDFWIFIFLILYAACALKGSLLIKLYWFLVMIASSKLVNGEMNHLTKGIASVLKVSGSEWQFQVGILSVATLLLGAVFGLLLLIFRKRTKENDPSPLLLITYFLCILLVDLFFTVERVYQVPEYYFQIGCLTSLLIAVLTIIIQKTMLRFAHREQVYRFREQMLSDRLTQTDEMREMYASMQKLRHDMNAYVQDIRSMVDAGRLPETPLFFEKMEEQLKLQYSTGNLALDSVLSVKVAKMEQWGIEFRGANLHYTGGMNITDSALCSLLSNMLDNACEALNDRKDRPGERFIYLQFSYTPGGLVIICENPLLGVLPKMRKESFLSTKKEVYHGLGISIMQKIVEDTGGQFDITVSDDLFRILTLIPLAETDDASEVSKADDQKRSDI